MRKFAALTLALLSGCAAIQRSQNAPSAAPVSAANDFSDVCTRYTEGFTPYFTIEARIKKSPIPNPTSARDLVAYLEARPRRTEADRTARNRALQILRRSGRERAKLKEKSRRAVYTPPPEVSSALTALGKLTRECDYGNVPYGWTVVIENRKNYGFTPAESTELRREVLRYLHDHDTVAVDLNSISIRVNLADAAVRSKFLKLKKPAKNKLAALQAEVDSELRASLPLTAPDVDTQARSLLEDVRKAAKFLARLRAILPTR